jgi:hypothetical protein
VARGLQPGSVKLKWRCCGCSLNSSQASGVRAQARSSNDLPEILAEL